jgi:hypothetical protein
VVEYFSSLHNNPLDPGLSPPPDKTPSLYFIRNEKNLLRRNHQNIFLDALLRAAAGNASAPAAVAFPPGR